MKYDKAYKKIKNVFGVNPETILRNNYHLIERSTPVLDIGAGQGRHALFLAKRGYHVDAIDSSTVACGAINDISRSKNLEIKTYAKKFDAFKPVCASYSAVLIFGLIQSLRWTEINSLIKKIDKWTKPGSLIFVTCWSVNDPALTKNIDVWEKIGRNSYTNSKGGTYTFLEKDEILKLFDGNEIIHHWEGLGPIHTHGDNNYERHGRIEAIFRR